MTERIWPHNVSKILADAAAATPNALAITLGSECVNFGDMFRRSSRMARVLEELGLRRGSRLLLWSRMDLRAVDVFFACSHIGCMIVPVNPAMSLAEALRITDYIHPDLIVADDFTGAMAENLSRPCGIRLAGFGSAHPVAGADLNRLARRASDRPVDLASIRDDDIFTTYLTSGSTGAPKGVAISQNAHWLRSQAGGGWDISMGGGGVVNMFPLFHMAGWHVIIAAWARKRATHLCFSADAEALLSIVELHRAVELYCIPAVWRRILDCRRPYDLGSLRYALSGTSTIGPDLILEIRARIPQAHNALLYGSTEMGLALGIAHEDILRRPGSVGIPCSNIAARIDADNELLLRGEGMMTGYLDLPDESAAAIRDGWYHSGDLATRDADGFFTITGRRREIIRSGGESIAPAEVEAALAGLAGVAEVAVVGLPDDQWGELVCAAIVPQEGVEAPSLAKLRTYLEGRLATFKHPRKLYLIGELPRTRATGQIQRALVRGQVMERASLFKALSR